jgi:hypothetical protein
MEDEVWKATIAGKRTFYMFDGTNTCISRGFLKEIEGHNSVNNDRNLCDQDPSEKCLIWRKIF